jgi:hypothetical protein
MKKLLLLSILLIVGCNNSTEPQPEDCAGVASGTAEEDCAGVCGGNTTQEVCDACQTSVFDCAGACEGNAVKDGCGVCDNDPTNDCVPDCDDVWGGENNYCLQEDYRYPLEIGNRWEYEITYSGIQFLGEIDNIIVTIIDTVTLLDSINNVYVFEHISI